MLALLDVLSDFIEPFIGLLFEKVWKRYNNVNYCGLRCIKRGCAIH